MKRFLIPLSGVSSGRAICAPIAEIVQLVRTSSTEASAITAFGPR
jgi:hypothetical protein